MKTCTINKLPESIAPYLYEDAYKSFNNALYISAHPLSVVYVKNEDIRTSMQLLKKWLKNDMDKLLHEGLWLNHDDLKNNKSAYLQVLYNAFVDICNEHGLRRVVDKSLFKGKLNCRRTEIERNMSYEEKRDDIMKQITDGLREHIKTMPQKIPQKNMSSIMSILEDWFEELARRHYQFTSGHKKNRLYLSDIIINDIEWFRDRLMTGQFTGRFTPEEYDNGRKRISYPCVFDVIMDSTKEAGCPSPEDDMDEKAIMKLIIQAVYNMGRRDGMHDCYDSY